MTPATARTFRTLQTIALGLALLFIFLDRVVIPQITANRAAESVMNEKRFTKLETNYENIEKLLNEINRKIDNHIERSK